MTGVCDERYSAVGFRRIFLSQRYVLEITINSLTR